MSPRVPATPTSDAPPRREFVPCSSCIFWRPTHDGAGAGKCVRFPPTGGSATVRASNPITHADATCGEGVRS